MRQSDIEDLARQVYPIIRPVAGRRGASIAYSEVTRRLHGRWEDIDPHSIYLAAALGAISSRCLARGLPALSALVVHAGDDRRPGGGYFLEAHPGIEDPLEREIAWAKEFEAVHQATYPESFDDLEGPG